METIYQNVWISGEKGDLSHFIRCLLARVIRSKLMSLPVDRLTGTDCNGNHSCQNVRISGEKGDLSHFIGCLLARVIRSKLIPVQLDHPVLHVIILTFTSFRTDSLRVQLDAKSCCGFQTGDWHIFCN